MPDWCEKWAEEKGKGNQKQPNDERSLQKI